MAHRQTTSGWTRRRLLACGLGGIAGVGAAGLELVDHGVLPGKGLLDRLTGECSAAIPSETFRAVGPTHTGTFFSHARERVVGYTIAYPPGHGPGSRLPFALFLHGFGGNHTSRLGGVSLAQALAGAVAGRELAPMALVAADGGGLYWNPHPGDDPMAMLVDELIPMCRKRGLGVGERAIGAIGISMGGYGVLLLAERHPRLLAAVAAISPAVWTTYAQARSVNAGAFASALDFARDDVITHAPALAGTPVRIASGSSDPFRPGVEALARVLPRSTAVTFAAGCHDGAFFTSQQYASLAFLGSHLATSG
jgi:pimeloyl-ACP methyl ester carboxylesterase